MQGDHVMSLGRHPVPPDCWLLFDDSVRPARVRAFDPDDGRELTSIELPSIGRLVAGCHDAGSGCLWVLDASGVDQPLVAIDPSSGQELQRLGVPLEVNLDAGLAVDPDLGVFWLCCYGQGGEARAYCRDGRDGGGLVPLSVPEAVVVPA